MNCICSMLSDDIWMIVIYKLSNITDLIRLRSVCTCINTVFQSMIASSDINDTFPRRTFIKSNVCMTCDQHSVDTKCITYFHDNYPFRRLYICNNIDCFLKSINRFICDANREHLYPFVEWKNTDIWVPRSHGGLSPGTVITSPIYYVNDVPHAVTRFTTRIYNEKCENYDKKDAFVLSKSVPLSKLDTACSVKVLFPKLFVHCCHKIVQF